MSMNQRKMNDYSLTRVSSVLILAAVLIVSTFSFPYGTRADALTNNPPNEPSNPVPTNGSLNVSITTNLTWTGGDPDGDPVTYNVYFGTINPPAQVANNQSTTQYTPATMNYSTKYYWNIIAWDNQSTWNDGPVWEFTTIPRPNNPPTIPNSPVPANNSIGITINQVLSWFGGDVDNDTVVYDVYFGTTSPPPKVKDNQSSLTYNPGTLSYNTTYYWRIIAWDSFNASTSGPLWQFTTKEERQIILSFTSPIPNSFYFMDVKRRDLDNRTIIYGPITISVNATADSGIEKVEFIIDGKVKNTTSEAPYTYYWRPIIQFNGLSLKRTITVKAYDNEGHNATVELNITKWRFHALPWIVVGVVVASTLVQHTTIRGLVFNLKQTALGLTFFALRLHYKTVGPFQTTKGIIYFKQCKIGVLIGPMKMIQLGPLHKLTWISCSSLGKINFNNAGFSQGLPQRFQQNTLK